MPTKPAERNYSHRLLIDKLGVREKSRVSVVNIDNGAFLRLLRRRTNDVFLGNPREASDCIFYEANSEQELAELKSLKARIKHDGAIWVVSFKGKQATIRDVEVIKAAKHAGLVDNKVVSFSETHIALRLVIPVDRR